MKKSQKKRLERLCYLKVKVDEMENEKDSLQKEILAWPDRPGKDGVEVPPYGTLKLSKRSNWTVLDIIKLFKKIGKDTFFEICSVAAGKTGKLGKAVGTVGFKKLEKLGIIEQGEDSEFYTLKRNGVFPEMLKEQSKASKKK